MTRCGVAWSLLGRTKVDRQGCVVKNFVVMVPQLGTVSHFSDGAEVETELTVAFRGQMVRDEVLITTASNPTDPLSPEYLNEGEGVF